MLKHHLLLIALFCSTLLFANDNPHGKSPSLKNHLNADGSLKKGIQGNFDATGFKMSYDEKGKPLFSPSGPGDNYWEDGFGYGGINGAIYAIAVSGTDIYVGGIFTDAGGVAAADYVAKWDGTQWSALGQGTDMYVNAIAVIGSDIYVGGQFNNVKNADGSNVAGTMGIARWDGTQWNAMGYGVNNDVWALAVSGTNLYVGGNFYSAMSDASTAIPSSRGAAIWDGTTWTSMHNININGEIRAIAIAGTKVYVGGSFNDAGGVAAADWLACWTGTTWTALGTSVNLGVYSIAVSGSNVYVGGNFTAAGGVANTKRIARWNGSAWFAMGGGVSDINYPIVESIVISGTDVIIGGSFLYVKSNATTDVSYTGGIARWNGTAWSSMQRGVIGTVYAMVMNSNLLVAGSLRGINSTGLNLSNTHNIAQWTGTTWQSTGMYDASHKGLDADVTALIVSGNDVYVGGSFTDAGGIADADFIARWDGSQWHSLGTGVNSTVRAITIMGSDIYIGGEFSVAGGIAAWGIARWNGTSWSAMGTTSSTGILTLTNKDGKIYAGGFFTSIGGVAANYIAMWNGTSWSSLGTGTSGPVYSLAVSGNEIIAGGLFTTAGGIPAQNIARWSGTTWAPIGTANSGVDGIVRTILVNGTDIHVGGGFSYVYNNSSGASTGYYAKWNGTDWVRLTESQGPVYSIAILGDKIYLGTNNSSNKSLTMYNGTDVMLPGTGVNSYTTVSALAVQGNKIIAGGSFNGTYDRSKAFSKFGIFNELRPSLTTSNPLNITYNSATLGGEITVDGGLPITERGIVWSAVNAKPDTTNNRIMMGNGIGIFSDNATPLPANNDVVVRAYAKNEAGFVYGVPVNFNTPTVAGPVITSFSPQNGATGSSVTITGLNFNTIPSNNIVYFGATRAEVTSATSTTLEVTVPVCASYQAISVLNKELPAAAWSHKPFLVTFTSPGTITTASYASSVDFTLPAAAANSQIGDIDNDGKADIIVLTSSQVLVYRNTSTTGVIDASSLAAPVSVASGTFSSLGLVVADLDGDGLLDIAAGTTNYRITITRNTSTPGNIAFETSSDIAIINNVNSLLAADLNNDGKPELLYQYNYAYCYYSCSYYGNLYIHTNKSVPGKLNKESFSAISSSYSIYNMSSLEAGDIDNDGKIDLAGKLNNVVYIFKNTTPQFVNTGYTFSLSALSTPGNINFIKLADLDGDNKLDLVTEPLSVFRNIHSTGNITSSSFEPIVVFGTTGKIGINDIDGDGRPDIAMGSTSSKVHKNLADAGEFTTASLEAPVDFTGGTVSNMIVADIDGNSRPELIVTQTVSGSPLLSIYQNITLNTLPLTLVNFTGRLNGKDGLLNWTTSNEHNTLNFELERSIDGLTFSNAGTVAASGNSTSNRDYYFTDRNITSLNSNVIYYRLKMNDLDGRFSYSGIIALRISSNGNITVLYPNPVKESANVSIHMTSDDVLTYSIIDQSGKKMAIRNVAVKAGLNNIVINVASLASGTYTLLVQGTHLNTSVQFMKQ